MNCIGLFGAGLWQMTGSICLLILATIHLCECVPPPCREIPCIWMANMPSGESSPANRASCLVDRTTAVAPPHTPTHVHSIHTPCHALLSSFNLQQRIKHRITETSPLTCKLSAVQPPVSSTTQSCRHWQTDCGMQS
ncbi:hypothetical protein J3E69DRAFT_339131 [Trichoderma sp. SZMC 28015]